MEEKQTWTIVYWVVALMLLLTLQDAWQSATQIEVVPYSEFEKALEEGRIAKVTISDERGSRWILGHIGYSLRGQGTTGPATGSSASVGVVRTLVLRQVKRPASRVEARGHLHVV